MKAFKAPSVPSNPSEGVLGAVELAARSLGLSLAGFVEKVSLFVHGSTVATNTLLERKGAKVGLLVTEGFRDTLEIRRGLRADVWDHRAPDPQALVPRHLRLPVRERIAADGSVLTPLDPASVERAVATFRAEGVEAVAIAFLHSYRNAAHEQAVKAMVQQAMPDAWICTSSEVAPVVGEYERSSTAVVNAYVAPRVVPYLTELGERLAALGLSQDLLMIQSNGGATSIRDITSVPVQLILSGPAAGVGSLRFFGRDTGSRNLIAIEVGGTSCDVTLMQDDAVSMTGQIEVDGYHLSIPAVEIHTTGAGGGTIARVDAAGMMHAGPEGAGARPGPAAYGFGGDRPTVTDANLVLGRLKPGPYAGGSIVLDPDRAVEAVRRHLAEPLGIPIEQAAAGILQLVEQNIQHAIEQVSIERGYNPRHFTLVAAGGAGALHGPAAARAIGCRSLYIPRMAGVFCAFGMCNADIRNDFGRTWLRDLAEVARDGDETLDDAFAALEAQAAGALALAGFDPGGIGFQRNYQLRYFGQQWTVEVGCDSTDAATVRAAFERNYQRLYGHLQGDAPVEVVSIRVAAVSKLPPLWIAPSGAASEAPVPVARRRVWVDARTGFADAAVYDGAALRPGQHLAGPAIIEEATTTILVGAGDELTVTDADNYLVRIGYEAEAHSPKTHRREAAE
ncbi:N-methylhydantoinase A [Aquamicrobium terrae]